MGIPIQRAGADSHIWLWERAHASAVKIGMIADLGMWYLCCGEGICDVWIPAGRILALFYCILLNEHGKYSKIIIILMTYAVKECAKRSDIVYREILGTFEERDIVG